ncbi:MAG: response regulator transcription factor [Acidimicrobiaceae bacterium]|nr:response regulator transcription factor [Acidimicrobiaceae bacterium]MBO0747382.1 response regulator transcription factor [Acidimicrobiaceae bacterium]
MVRVVVADDQSLIRQGFRMILAAQADIEVVAEAADGESAVMVVNETRPDVVLMDIRMPGVDGIEATRRIRAETGGPDAGDGPRVLILTTFGLDEYVAEALRAGAGGFLLKDSTPEELVRAVRVVAGGNALLSPEVTTRLIARVLPTLAKQDAAGTAPATTEAERDPRRAGLKQLTEREMEVLLAVARGRSNAEIGRELYISETTVKTHISHLLAKLDLRDRVQLVVAAYELGLLAPRA